uniref:TPR_REGION domain-containing protein n=1 Tax=Toxocara canis TaxID=6265 RepID=A0A183U6M0_TOXCA
LCPHEKLFRACVDLELQLREFDRCRILYGKFLEYSPEKSTTWMKFAELETLLGDTDRARAMFALAVQQPALDMPEVFILLLILEAVTEGDWSYSYVILSAPYGKFWLRGEGGKIEGKLLMVMYLELCTGDLVFFAPDGTFPSKNAANSLSHKRDFFRFLLQPSAMSKTSLFHSTAYKVGSMAVNEGGDC